jgi:hypothetical protein
MLDPTLRGALWIFLKKLKVQKNAKLRAKDTLPMNAKNFFIRNFMSIATWKKLIKQYWRMNMNWVSTLQGIKHAIVNRAVKNTHFFEWIQKKEHPGTEEAEHFLLTCLARARTMFYNFLQGLDSWLEGDLL